MTDFADGAVAFRHGIAEENPKQVLNAIQQLQSKSLDDLLSQLSTAIDEGRDEDARIITVEISHRYEAQRPEENAVIASAETARSVDETEFEQIKQFTSFLQEATQTKLQRSQLLLSVSSFVNAPNQESDPSDVKSTIEGTREQDTNFQTSISRVESTLENTTLPPSIEITSTTLTSDVIRPDSTAKLTVRVKNVGDEAATGVAISIDPPAQVTVSDTEFTLGTLSGGETISREVEVGGTSTGTFSFSVDSSSNNAGVSLQTVSITVSEQASPPPFPGLDSPPTDPDGDGKFEDVNGNNIQGFGDVVTLFENLRSEVVLENPELYDYNDNGIVGFGDVIHLFETI